MGEFDPELLQPRFLPKLAGITLNGLRLGSGIRAVREERGEAVFGTFRRSSD